LQGVFHFDWARSAVLYRGEVRERIHQLKFSRQLYQVPMMVDLLARAVAQGTDWPAFELIVPVPLHSRRLQQRGFNQAGLIARKLGPKLGLPVHLGVLVRRRWTEPQTRLGRTERLHNVKGAFAVTKAAVVRERCVLLVDDVYTTGTTLSEGARVLKAAGAGMVGALTIARALPDALSEPQ
jgi:ComF family protein